MFKENITNYFALTILPRKSRLLKDPPPASLSPTILRRSASGDKVYIEATYNPIFDPAGNVIKVVKFASDITDKVQRDLNISQAIADSSLSQETPAKKPHQTSAAQNIL